MTTDSPKYNHRDLDQETRDACDDLRREESATATLLLSEMRHGGKYLVIATDCMQRSLREAYAELRKTPGGRDRDQEVIDLLLPVARAQKQLLEKINLATRGVRELSMPKVEVPR